MATAVNLSDDSIPLVSVEEYVARFVDGDEKPAQEYVDGLLEHRGVGTEKHGIVQAKIATLINQFYESQFTSITELTSRTQETRFYIPDVAVEEVSKPIAGCYPGPGEPVYLCVEVLSPPNRLGKMFAKCEEYHRWGVLYCWVVDPETKRAWEYYREDAEWREVNETLTAGAISLSLAEVFRRV